MFLCSGWALADEEEQDEQEQALREQVSAHLVDELQVEHVLARDYRQSLCNMHK